MIRNVLESIAGAEIFAVISLLIFVLVFCTMVFFAIKANKQYLNKMASMPLDDENPAITWQQKNGIHRI